MIHNGLVMAYRNTQEQQEQEDKHGNQFTYNSHVLEAAQEVSSHYPNDHNSKNGKHTSGGVIEFDY
jgi:hypothetical protein